MHNILGLLNTGMDARFKNKPIVKMLPIKKLQYFVKYISSGATSPACLPACANLASMDFAPNPHPSN